MVDVDKAVIARLRKGGNAFEILVDCDKALEYKKDVSVPLEDVLASDEVYEDVKKGMVASEDALKKSFDTTNKTEVVKKILKDGHVQLTAEHQKKYRAQKRKQIIGLIHRNAVDPKTGVPHPPARIESAMDEVKVRVDDFKSAESQVKEIVSKLKTVLPIKYEIRVVALVLPPQYAGKGQNIVRKYGNLGKESWLNDGSFSCEVEIPAGMYESFEKELNDLTRGNLDMNIIGRK